MRTPARHIGSPTRIAWLVALVVTIVAGFAVLAGCGGSDDSGVAKADTTAGTTETTGTGTTGSTTTALATGKDRETKLLAFSKCMRTDGGVSDFPDPEADENGELQIPQPRQGSNQKELQDGFQKCQKNLEGVFNTSPESQAALQDAQLEFAKCIRGEGIDVPDPDPDNPNALFSAIDQNDPKTMAAFDKCAPIFQEAQKKATGGS